MEDAKAKYDPIKEQYEDRILEYLQSIADEFDDMLQFEAGEPFDMHNGEYRWVVFVTPKACDHDHDNPCMEVSFTISESVEHEGESGGVNFALQLSHDGRPLGGLIPHNFTDDCWVDIADDEAVEERFKVVEGQPPKDLIMLAIDDLQ